MSPIQLEPTPSGLIVTCLLISHEKPSELNKCFTIKAKQIKATHTKHSITAVKEIRVKS